MIHFNLVPMVIMLHWLLCISLFTHVFGASPHIQCQSDVNCKGASGTYCNQRLRNCQSCWTCCVYPEIYGSCPFECDCHLDRFCFNHHDCDVGLFCDDTTSTCKKCSECVSACPDYTCLYDSEGDRGNDRDNFMTLMTLSINPYPYVKSLQKAQVEEWYGSMRVHDRSRSISSIFENNNSLTRTEFVDRMKLFERVNACVDRGDIGCPCTPSSDAKPCSAGAKCVNITGAFTDMDAFQLDFPIYGGVCVPCVLGQYCPRGSRAVDNGLKDARLLRCPKGFYCPSPETRIACANGSYCSGGNFMEFPCDFEKLLFTTVYVEQDQDTVFQRLVKFMDPFKGNFCPANATRPGTKCPGGFYCPSPREMIKCPRGYFCKSQSTKPRKCPVVTRCPGGTEAPGYSGMAYVFGFIVLLIILLLNSLDQLGWSTSRSLGAHVHDKPETLVSVEVRNAQEGPEFDTRAVFSSLIYRNISTRNDRKKELLSAKRDILQLQSLVAPISWIEIHNASAREDMSKDPWLWPNSVRFVPCKLNAIMGGSGCGKSTLLELLRGRVKSGVITGDVTIAHSTTATTLRLPDIEKVNKLRRTWQCVNVLRGIRGFVPQDDIVYPDLTVKENLEFSARLKYSRNKWLVECVVNSTMHIMKMVHVADRIVGTVERRGISGGQRKRVNIGMEVVCLPSLLMMDEPTSGLDSAGTQTLVEFCKTLTELGMTVVMVVHQPRYSCFMMFDEVIFLSKYGTVFCGSPAMSLLYFQHALDVQINPNDNPCDAIMDLIYTDACAYDQKELVGFWNDGGGKAWVDRCVAKYPLAHMILDESIVMDDVSRYVLKGLMYAVSHTKTVTPAQLKMVFDALYIDVTLKDMRELCAFIKYKAQKRRGINLEDFYLHENATRDAGVGVGEEIPFANVVAFFNEVCADAYINNTYSNVVDKLKLFTNAPADIIENDDAKDTRKIVYAMKFARRLLKGKQRDNATNQKEHVPLKTVNAIILASMSCKAIYTEKTKIDISSDIAELGEDLGEKLAMPSRVVNALDNIIVICWRRMLTFYRSPWPIQIIIPMGAAFIIGSIQGTNKSVGAFPNNVTMAMVCIAVLSMVTHIRTFSLDKVIIAREIDSKSNMFTFFLGYNLVDLIWTILLPIVFFVPYYYLSLPYTGPGTFIAAGMLVCWWSSGLAYVISSLPLALHWANLIGVFITVIFGAFVNGLTPSIKDARGTFTEFILAFSYNRWVIEALTLHELRFYEHDRPNVVWNMINAIGLCNKDIDLNNFEANIFTFLRILKGESITIEHECSQYMTKPYVYMFLFGLAFRCIAFVILWSINNVIVSRIHWKAIQTIKTYFAWRKLRP